MRIVGDDAESGVDCVFLHDATQRHLGRIRHGISLVEDNELEAGHGVGFGRRAHGEDLLRARKRLDLLADHVNATVVRGVELQHHLPHVGGAVDTPGQGEDGGRLSRAGRSVEEEMWEAVGVDELIDGR